RDPVERSRCPCLTPAPQADRSRSGARDPQRPRGRLPAAAGLMRGGTRHSLKRRLVTRLIAVQAAVVALVVLAVFLTLWLGGHFASKLEPEDAILDAVAHALRRDGDGRLSLRPTQELTELRRRSPDLWFVVRDADGAILSEGRVPEEYAR